MGGNKPFLKLQQGKKLRLFGFNRPLGWVGKSSLDPACPLPPHVQLRAQHTSRCPPRQPEALCSCPLPQGPRRAWHFPPRDDCVCSRVPAAPARQSPSGSPPTHAPKTRPLGRAWRMPGVRAGATGRLGKLRPGMNAGGPPTARPLTSAQALAGRLLPEARDGHCAAGGDFRRKSVGWAEPEQLFLTKVARASFPAQSLLYLSLKRAPGTSHRY